MLEPHAAGACATGKGGFLMLKGRRDCAGPRHPDNGPLEARNTCAWVCDVPLLVVALGVDVEGFLTRPATRSLRPSGGAGGQATASCSGAIDPIRARSFLAEAWGRLTREFPDWVLVMAGPDWRGHQAVFEAALAKHSGAKTKRFSSALF